MINFYTNCRWLRRPTPNPLFPHPKPNPIAKSRICQTLTLTRNLTCLFIWPCHGIKSVFADNLLKKHFNLRVVACGCMQDTFARATHSAYAAGRPSAARDDRVSCIQGLRVIRNQWLSIRCNPMQFKLPGAFYKKNLKVPVASVE